jgi:hypothetical protein
MHSGTATQYFRRNCPALPLLTLIRLLLSAHLSPRVVSDITALYHTSVLTRHVADHFKGLNCYFYRNYVEDCIVLFYFHFHSLQKMREGALTKCLRERMLVRTKPPVPKDWQTINLAEVVPTISVFVLGILVSVLVLVVECLAAGLERR